MFRHVHRCVAFWVLWIGLLGVDWVWRDGIDIVRPCLDLDWCGGDQAVARDHREEELGVRVGRGEETVGNEAHWQKLTNAASSLELENSDFWTLVFLFVTF
ncbi:hypothetical protein BLNAU_14989 [Blattamonas nauphoetae]|uniref:Secreted protein n=1 Tax=Blattamonas nauphoetae TaxID=2049346 RepID=A0ABQ9XHF4_9EUKA|nr:hypothetical protein BLNAU_14989 [Blattamonas nauphoetae]